MRILIVTPLFPPDTAPSAKYTKELATRLRKDHEVVVLLYGHTPETIDGVRLITVDKRRPSILRAFSFMHQLQTQAWLADIIIIQNGPSVELPSYFTLEYTKTPIIFMKSDPGAMERLKEKPTYHTLHQRLTRRANAVFAEGKHWPLLRPLIHPLQPYPEKALGNYERSWQKHLDQLHAMITACHDRTK
jgi:glycosyltransferase involved in cell wall biosynthesis